MKKNITRYLLILLILGAMLLAGCTTAVAPEVVDAATDTEAQEPAESEAQKDTLVESDAVAEGAAPPEEEETPKEEPIGAIYFEDDMGSMINLDQACERMIVLYSAHIENLYSLGVGDKIIGGYKTAIYPPDAATKPFYDYRSDPEKVIAADPDCLVIRPFINRKSPDFVAAIENTGIPVISLYPDSFDDFDEYIMKLGMMSGTEDVAEELLDEFYARIDAITEITASIEPKRTAYFESTATNYRTVTIDSMPARAIEFAGGINIASDVEPISDSSSIASYGIEKILINAEEIDVYITQRGAMNAGGNTHSISIREGFDNITAVQNEDVLEINEKLVSSPTFRYYKGVSEIARALYPEVMDELDSFRSDELINREGFAEVIVRFTHRQIYVPSSSRYYTQDHSGHTYGLFQDVAWDHPRFDYIETAVLAGLIDIKEDESGEYFDPAALITKDELAKTVYIIGDFERQEGHIQINDLDQCVNARIVQILVDNGVFDLEDGDFNPQNNLTYSEVIDLLAGLSLE
jgi:iron complex transport system substrate-binding protein